MRHIAKWSALFVLALALSMSAFAQQGGGLQGRVTDEAGQPVIGAMIQVTGASLAGFQGAATDTTGQYNIPFLPVGQNYQVKVEAPGYNSVVRKGIGIQLGSTVSLPFVLSQGKTEIVVTAAAPVIDSKSTEVGANVSDKMINSIPLARNAGSIAFLAPTAVTSGQAGQPALGGATGSENSYTVNGIDVTSTGYGTNQSSLNFDFIEATEVKVGGMDAEYGALMGGSVNQVTKSGGNEFHGGLFTYYWDGSLGAQEIQYPWVTNYIDNQTIYDFGGFLGGYFIKDKLWFFAAYDYNKSSADWLANGSDGNVYLNPGGSGTPFNPNNTAKSWANGTGYTNKTTDPQWAFKLTWNISANHKLTFSYFGDNLTQDVWTNLNNISPAGSPLTQKTDNYALSAQWNATWTPKFFTEVVVGERNTDINQYPSSAGASNYMYYYRYGNGGNYGGWQVIPLAYDAYNTTTRAIDLTSWLPSLGRGGVTQVKDQNEQIRIKATNLFNALGRHELSYGWQYYNIKYDNNFQYTGNPVPVADLGGQMSVGGGVVRWQRSTASPSGFLFRFQGYLDSRQKNTTQKYNAYWAQDNWNLTDYFMLKVGLRLDQLHMLGGPTAQYSSAGTYYAPARGISINDEWAPRIGFTWDVAHNNKSKLYGFWGQYYERFPNDMAVRALMGELGLSTYFYNYELTQPQHGSTSVNGSLGTYVRGTPTSADGTGLKGSYNEESILGFQYEVAPDFTVGVRGVYRNLGRVVEDISVDGTLSYYIANPDQWTNIWAPDAGYLYYQLYSPIYGGGKANPFYYYHNRASFRYRFPKPTRIYKALELTAEKRFSNHWMMQASYVLSRLEGNYEGLFSNDNGQADPNITSKYDLPQLLVNGYGLLPNDRTHVLKVFGGYFFDNIPLELSGNFQLQSGIPISKLGAGLAEIGYGVGEGFCTTRGSAGRTPTTWTLDIGAQYTFKIWKSNLALRADIFNVTNNQVTTDVNMDYNTVNVENYQTNTLYGKPNAHQVARRIRLALRWTF
jgi:hypothetical protein